MAKQQKEFQEQMEQMIVQNQAERSPLKNQVQQLKIRWQQQYYPNIFTNGLPVFPNTTYPIPTVHPNQSSLNSSLRPSIQNTMTQPPTIGTMTIQTETEDQATQDNTPPTPSDTTRHPVAYPDTKLDFEHDPELDFED